MTEYWPGGRLGIVNSPPFPETPVHRRLVAMLREEGDPRMLDNAAFFDTIKYTGPDGHSYDKYLKYSPAK